MALDISGIDNVGEFYSHHYLSAVLEGDLKAVLKGWREREKAGEGRAPHKALAALATHYFRCRNEASDARDEADRWRIARDFHVRLLEVLGYPYAGRSQVHSLPSGSLVPLVSSLERDGNPYLWIIDGAFPLRDEEPDDDGPFELTLPAAQLPEGEVFDGAAYGGTVGELLDGPLFRQDRPPRWVLYLAAGDAWLIERHKWPQGQLLRFRLGELFSRRDNNAMKATAAMLHRDVLAPDTGACLHDTLDEKSHKHAFAVSTDLKHGVRKAVELLANEMVYFWKDVRREGVFRREIQGKQQQGLDAAQLTRECLIWLYRLLFLFYAEARGKELGVVPMDSTTYRLGYSLESLRDLEQVPLHTEQARNGTYIHDSLKALFRILNRGYNQRQTRQMTLGGEDVRDVAEAGDRFRLLALRSRLFDEAATPLLKPAQIRNHVMQEILRLLSLSRPSKKRSRGRISYAQLGINQLGAVYEGLLSYSGFFAEEDLVEVKAAADMDDAEARSYFVPKPDLGRYEPKEIVREDGLPVEYPRGSFVFRLAGRDREKSASYYTPEVLTECLTRYTLKERLEGLKADEILGLTICEPAMGSGAFLNEAVNQLADAYLTRKQGEPGGTTIPADQYQAERQKVKYHFAVNNCYGVDLNPLAAELGKVSLWLNVLHPGARAPFFDLRIGTGNSLMGGRREVFRSEHLVFDGSKKNGANWLTRVPERVPVGEARPKDTVWHFLLPDAGMAPFDKDKVVKALDPEAVAQVKQWRKAFTRRLTPMEVQTLQRLSQRVDALWQEHVRARRALSEQLRERVALWGQPPVEAGLPLSEELGTEVLQRELRGPSAPGRRLGAVMDAWCALWVWPLKHAERLPTRAQWLTDVEALLDSADVTATMGASRRLRIVAEVTRRAPCFHWELQFAEAFADRGGFDVILGNPPWLKLEWKEAGVLGDYEPLFTLRSMSAKQVADARARVMEDEAARSAYFEEFEMLTGVGRYLNATQTYPLLKGVQTNLYKCFLTRGWQLGAAGGQMGLIHQPGLFSDPKGGALRRHLHCRLRLLCVFKNELMLFAAVGHPRPYCISVSAARPSAINYRMLGIALHPRTLDQSAAHDGRGSVPGLKDADGNWDLKGHRSRVVEVDDDTLGLFATLYDAPGTPAREARLPVVHSREILAVLRKFAAAPRRLGDLAGQYFATEHFHETNQQHDGTIRRETRLPETLQEWVLSGPHFYVGTPLNKTPNEGCKSKGDYSPIDLTAIEDDYLPRTNFVPACDPAEYRRRTPHWNGRPVTEFYRHVHRRLVAPTGARTLVPFIAPPGPAHVHTILSLAMDSHASLAYLSGLASSLVYDFFIKTTGKSDLYAETFGRLPLPAFAGRSAVVLRALRLNCLTTPYAPLWEELYSPRFHQDMFAKPDPRLPSGTGLTPKWQRECALRTPFERRQALVELDALATLALGLTADQLCLIYRVQFPVLQQYERETFYDQRGKIVFTVNKGLSGVGLDRKQWTEIQHARAGDGLPDWAVDQTGAFVPPFDRCDREADMRQAYGHFEPLVADDKS